jgi:hypothetical protein
VIQTQADNHLGGHDTTWNQYNFPGWLLRTRRQHSAIVDNQLQELTVNQRYTYDHAGRVLDTYHQLGDNGNDEQLISSQTYNERDELEKKEVGEYTTGNYLQTIDYAYNIRGWLTDINDFSAGDLFSFKLHYNELNANVPSGGANYNGNISQVEWQVKGADNHQFYGFTYDGLDRLTAAAYIEKNGGGSYVNSDRYKTSYSYDLNGNIETLKRHGWHSATETYQSIDSLSYTYAANGQLTQVQEQSSLIYGYKAPTTTNAYTYDGNGNLQTDAAKNMFVDYNVSVR